jgi:hypothetical protein
MIEYDRVESKDTDKTKTRSRQGIHPHIAIARLRVCGVGCRLSMWQKNEPEEETDKKTGNCLVVRALVWFGCGGGVVG